MIEASALKDRFVEMAMAMDDGTRLALKVQLTGDATKDGALIRDLGATFYGGLLCCHERTCLSAFPFPPTLMSPPTPPQQLANYGSAPTCG